MLLVKGLNLESRQNGKKKTETTCHRGREEVNINLKLVEYQQSIIVCENQVVDSSGCGVRRSFTDPTYGGVRQLDLITLRTRFLNWITCVL